MQFSLGAGLASAEASAARIMKALNVVRLTHPDINLARIHAAAHRFIKKTCSTEIVINLPTLSAPALHPSRA
jgi:hypothetical protein